MSQHKVKVFSTGKENENTATVLNEDFENWLKSKDEEGLAVDVVEATTSASRWTSIMIIRYKEWEFEV